ncbi:hypothetical protein ACP275_10G147700 [Erythranthe tilingii]
MGIYNPLCVCVFSLIFTVICHHRPSVAFPAENGGIANSTKAAPPPAAVESRIAPFKPGIAAIVGIITTIFAMTFLLLLYVKHCKRSGYAADGSASYGGGGGHRLSRRNSGINRKVIESLPLFRFSSLRGQKDGLECAVCLNRFEAEEVLRLLPKCKHAFHIECVDTWLDEHSTCPLCRYRVDPEDILLIVDGGALYNHCGGDQPTPRGSASSRKGKEHANPRISGRHSSAGERSGSLEVIVENPNPNPNPIPREDFRGRISLDSWKSTRRKTGDQVSRSKSLDSWKTAAAGGGRRSKSARKDGQLPVKAVEHRLEHRIIISGGGGGEGVEEGQRRWSDVEAAAELLYLGSEMLIEGAEGEESGRSVIKGRSVSEITGVSRYRSNNGGGGKEERERMVDEGVVKRWLSWISHSQHPSLTPPSSSSLTHG